MISAKLFIGCHLSPDLRIQLNQSLAWKHSRLHTEPGVEPVEIRHEGRDYLGFFLPRERAELLEVRANASPIRDAICRYCQKYPVDRLRLYVFPQLFVS